MELPMTKMAGGFASLMSAEDVALTAAPVSFDLYAVGTNHSDMIMSWTSPEPLYFVSITGLTNITDYEVSESTVRLKTSYLSKLAVGDTELVFNFLNDASAPIAVTKAITVINTAPVVIISPETVVFDCDPASLGYTDLAFTYSGADFVDITGLTPGTEYTFAGNTLTILKEYLQTLPLRDKEFVFRFGEGGSVPVSVTVSIIDSRYPPLSVNGTPVTEGSGTGWTYADHVLTITADACTLSGVSDTDSIVINSSITSVILNDLRINTTGEFALKSLGHSPKTLTVNLQGANRLESQSYGMYSSADFVVLGSGSLVASGIYGDNITVRGGTIQVNNRQNNPYGIYAASGMIEISGGSVTVTKQGTSKQYALYALGNIVISGGTLSVTVEGNESSGLYSFGNIDISGGTIDITSRASGIDTFNESYGLHADNVSISGGQIDMDVTSADGSVCTYAHDIDAPTGTITISGGSISAYARAVSGIEKNSAGMYADFITIHSGSINTQTVSIGDTNYGLYADKGDITLGGGTLATDGYYGLYAKVGNIVLNGGIVKTDGSYGLYSKIGSIALSSSTVVANSSMKGLFSFYGTTMTDSMVAASSVQGTPVIDGSMYFLGANHAYTLQNVATVVDTDMLLPQGSTFTIPAGFTVQLLDGAKLKVAGTLINNGTILGAVVEADGSPYKVRSITLSAAEAQLISGDALQLTAAALPNFAANRAITWSSSNEAVAAVDTDGKVTTKSPGQAIITATAQDAGGAASTCTLTVIRLASGITLNMTEAELYTGETQKLEATAAPEDASDKTVTWSTSDETIATVHSTGTVTAVKAGSAVIKATANDGSGVYASCTVTVKQYANGITLREDNLTLYLGETFGLTAAVKPDDASDKTVAWTTSDDTIATVDSDGKVTALNVGSAVITATANGGSKVSAQCQVTVKKHVTGITLNKNIAVLYTGETEKLETTVTPDDASDKTVTWSTSNGTIATVDATGTVTARKAGSAVIKATANDGSGVYAACTVTVKQYAAGITLSSNSLTIYIGETSGLTAAVKPADTSDKTVAWSTSDGTVATVGSNGMVTALKTGSAVITATANGGSKVFAQCQVTVKKRVTGITLNSNSAVLYTGEMAALAATVLPDDASNKTITWSTSNASVAAVNASGTVTALKAGSAVIRATANDGSGIYAQCTVTVKQRITGITLSAVSITIYLGKTAELAADVQPADASNKSVTWATSNGASVAVDASGVISGLKEGTAAVTATANDGSGASAVCNVTVIKRYAAGITLNASSITLYTGKEAWLTAAVMSEDTYDKTLIWSSTNPAVAAVDSAGKVSALYPGTALITASATDGSGITAACTVTVYALVTGITLSYSNITIAAGQTVSTVTAYILPENASNKSLKWLSSNPSIAAVDANGYITGVQTGSAYITAAAQDGSEKSASVLVYVVAPKKGVTAIRLNKSSAAIDEGKTLSLSARLTPSSPQNKTVAWSSSNPAVASVNGKGKVTALTPGTIVITATASSGVSAQCTVTVRSLAVSRVILKKYSIAVDERKTASLSASVLPRNARFKSVSWSSSDPSVASVSQKGKITTYKPGTVQIIATANNGVSAACTLTVRSLAVTSVSLNKAALLLKTGKLFTLKAALLPRNTLYKAVTWTSSNPAVATVTSGGKVRAVGQGTATITATSHNGITASCNVTVP
jgi:uncharacterized protein YjdB